MQHINLAFFHPPASHQPRPVLIFLSALAASGLASAQPQATSDQPQTAARPGWQVCQTMVGEQSAQLKCFNDWAAAQAPPKQGPLLLEASAAEQEADRRVAPFPLPPLQNTKAPDGKPIGCRDDKYSALSRFWELQRGTDCDNFSIRGYRPITLAVVTSGSVNSQPFSPATGHSAATAQAYSRNETKIQLSVRTKIAKGLLKTGPNDEDDQDSVWMGYTQQSYWQLFNGAISRPFRSTDHEPEVIYIYPHKVPLAGGWDYRLSGLGLVHQSNGQSLPLSRSWNRTYLMGAAEKTLGPNASVTLQARVWDRLRESSGNDDNPGIENYIGRAEVAANWQISKNNTLGMTVRHSLRREARGSTRIDWMLAPSTSPTYTGLRYHVQLFNGYGDGLLDYNRKRSVLSVGLSLIDW